MPRTNMLMNGVQFLKCKMPTIKIASFMHNQRARRFLALVRCHQHTYPSHRPWSPALPIACQQPPVQTRIIERAEAIKPILRHDACH